MIRRALVMVALAASVGQAVPALASPPSAQDLAAQLKEKGDTAMRAGRFADALFAYRASYDAWPNPRVLFNEARAHEVLGQYPEALEYLERFSRDAPSELLAEVPGVAQMIADVRTKVAVVEVRSNVADARVAVRERSIALGRQVYLVPGRAAVEASAEGFKAIRKDVELPGGESTVVDLAFEPLVLPAPPVAPLVRTLPSAAAPALPAALPETKSASSRRIVAASFGGVGVVGLAIAGGLALGAKSKYDDVGGHCTGTSCDQQGLDVRDAARRQGNVATAIGLASVACVAAGVVLWITAPSSPARRVRVGVGFTGVSLGGTF